MKKSEQLIAESANVTNSNANDIELVKTIIDTVSNLNYGSFMIIDANKRTILFSHKNTRLSTSYKLKNVQNCLISTLLKSISIRNNTQIDRVLDIIKTEYLETPLMHRDSLLFLTDIIFSLNEGDTLASLKLSPFSVDCGKHLTHFLCSMTLSVGAFTNKLFFLNNATNERKIYDLNNGYWSKIEFAPLTPVETSVLALSAQGYEVTEISGLLHKSAEGVRSARKRIFQKLEVKNITQAILTATSLKVI